VGFTRAHLPGDTACQQYAQKGVLDDLGIALDNCAHCLIPY
jgi:hypothetical protein